MNVSDEVLQARGSTYGYSSDYGAFMMRVMNTLARDAIAAKGNAIAEYGTGGPEYVAQNKMAQATTPNIQAGLHAAQIWGSGSPEYRAVRSVHKI